MEMGVEIGEVDGGENLWKMRSLGKELDK